MQADDDVVLHAVRYGSYAVTMHQANYSADDLKATISVNALKSIDCLHSTDTWLL